MRLLWKVVHVFMERTPSQLDLHLLCYRLEGLEGLTGIHDIHVWSITIGYNPNATDGVAVMVNTNPVLQRLRDKASSELPIAYVTT